MTSDPGIPVTTRDDDGPSPLLRAAIWVAIGALIAAALVCVVWVLLGSQNGIVGRAFLTILLLVGFAGVAILDAHLAPRRPAWFALASMATWIVTLLIGSVMIWMPDRTPWGGSARFVQFLVIVLILQLALLHVRLYMKAFQRYVTAFTQTVVVITIGLVVALTALLVVPLMLSEWVRFADIYWRIVVAVAILAAVGTALIPLVNVLFAPRRPKRVAVPAYGAHPPYGVQPVPASYGATPALAAAPVVPAPHPGISPIAPPVAQVPVAEHELLPWPFFADGRTPLPMLPDGSPDWAAYYTGYPSEGAHVFVPEAEQAPEPQAAEPALEPAPDAQHPVASEPASTAESARSEQSPTPDLPTPAGYEGYPPPPPLPPRS